MKSLRNAVIVFLMAAPLTAGAVTNRNGIPPHRYGKSQQKAPARKPALSGETKAMKNLNKKKALQRAATSAHGLGAREVSHQEELDLREAQLPTSGGSLVSMDTPPIPSTDEKITLKRDFSPEVARATASDAQRPPQPEVADSQELLAMAFRTSAQPSVIEYPGEETQADDYGDSLAHKYVLAQIFNPAKIDAAAAEESNHRLIAESVRSHLPREQAAAGLSQPAARTTSEEAPAPAKAPTHVIPGHERSAEEASKFIYDLGLEVVGGVLKPKGLVFEQCLKEAEAGGGKNRKFDILSYPSAEEAKKNPQFSQAGYRIYDRDHTVERCVARLSKDGGVCDQDDAHRCVNIADLYHDYISLDRAGTPHAPIQIGFARKVPNKINEYSFEQKGEYKSIAFRNREAREANTARGKAQLEEAQAEIAECARGDENDVKLAQQACGRLSQIRMALLISDPSLAGEVALLQASCEPGLLKELFLRTVAALKKSKSAQDFVAGADKIIKFANAHPEYTQEAIIAAFNASRDVRHTQGQAFQIAPTHPMEQQQRAQEERLAAANAILENMIQNLRMPESSIAALRNEQRELAVAGCQQMAQVYGMAPQVQYCLEQTYEIVNAFGQEACSSGDRAACMNAKMQASGLQNAYKAAVAKSTADQAAQAKFEAEQMQKQFAQGGLPQAGLSSWTNTNLNLTSGFAGANVPPGMALGSTFNPAYSPLQTPGLTNLGTQSPSLSTPPAPRAFGPLIPG